MLLNELVKVIAKVKLCESQCGLRVNRSKTVMVLSLDRYRGRVEHIY